MIRSASLVPAIAFAMATVHHDRAVHSRPPQDAAWLLPGYHHSTAGGIDSAGGRMWKNDGPDVYYETGPLVGEQARVYAQRNPKASLMVVESPATGEMVVALDEDQSVMVVINHRSHFMARNVRSRKDAVEVMSMATALAGMWK